MKKTMTLGLLLFAITVVMAGCGKDSKQADCEKACANLSGEQQSLCLSTCEKAAAQYEAQGSVDFSDMDLEGYEPNPDGLGENETAGVGAISNGVADGEVVGDDGYEMATPDTVVSSTGDMCDENWVNAECEEVNGQYKDSCYAELANDNKQECICNNKVESTTLKDSCNMAVAEAKADYTVCDYINSSDIQDGCYVAVAEKTKKVDPCNKVNNSMFKDGCYQTVASLLSDITICDMISSSAIQTTCKMEVSSK